MIRRGKSVREISLLNMMRKEEWWKKNLISPIESKNLKI